jgi:hypothetical protein
MLQTEVNSIYAKSYTKHTSAFCGQNVQFLNAKSDSAYTVTTRL